jgi:hypothetical protein
MQKPQKSSPSQKAPPKKAQTPKTPAPKSKKPVSDIDDINVSDEMDEWLQTVEDAEDKFDQELAEYLADERLRYYKATTKPKKKEVSAVTPANTRSKHIRERMKVIKKLHEEVISHENLMIIEKFRKNED